MPQGDATPFHQQTPALAARKNAENYKRALIFYSYILSDKALVRVTRLKAYFIAFR